MAIQTLQLTLRWNGITETLTVTEARPNNENGALPIVLLLHGTSGDLRDMANPELMQAKTNYNRRAYVPPRRDHGWRSYPGVGPWGHAVDPLVDVTDWQTALNNAGFRTLNYGQVDPSGSLGRPIAQLTALLRELMTRNPGRSFALIGHSRGGILARALLVDARKRGSFDLTRIRSLITLHSPNQGSSLANHALGLAALATMLRSVPGAEFVRPVIDFILAETGKPAYQDYAVNSPFLMNLAQQEPVPGIRYYTFGGNSTAITRHRAWMFTPESALPQWHLPPFQWSTYPVELGNLLPPLAYVPPELIHGTGDLLVTDARARLGSWAPHRTNALNHGEALWNAGLQQQVIGLLRTP